MRLFLYGLSGFILGSVLGVPLGIAGVDLSSDGFGLKIVLIVGALGVGGGVLGVVIGYLTRQRKSGERLLPSQRYDPSKLPRIPVVEIGILAISTLLYCSYQIKHFVAGTSAMSDGFVFGTILGWVLGAVFAIGMLVQRFQKQMKAHNEFKANTSTTSSDVESGEV